jgi:aminopeptidase N
MAKTADNKSFLAALIIIGIIGVAYWSHNNEVPVADDPVPLGQLARVVVPTHYALDLRLDPRESHFSATVAIDLDIAEAVDRIWLHGVDIIAESVVVETAGGNRITGSYAQVDPTGVAKISLDGVVPAGNARLVIRYRAPFNPALEGLYKVEEDGYSYAFTQFEATSARFAFPGFDDPQFKTPYDITMTVPSDQVAMTNTGEVASEDLGDGWKRVTFLTSQPLPTYLLAFAAGPLDVVVWDDIPPTALRQRPIPLRGIAAHGKGERMAIALENTAILVTTLEEYFGVEYPYDKLDIIAAPDFSAGAMENAGAIVYREQRLLMDENTSLASLRAYFGTHTHELAHMWFGDLVTPKWWDDIWLNESFATWMAFKALNIAFPEGGYGGLMADRAFGVMDTDSRVSARQVRQDILSNHDIGNAFDGITYSKGGAVLAMFEHFMGEDAFREGVRTHMRRFPFGNADVYDFLSSLEQGSGDNTIKAAFSSFILQPGLPQVKITDFESDDTGTRLNVNVVRYFPLGSRGVPDSEWDVPLCLIFGVDGKREQRCQLLEEPSSALSFDDITNAEFIFPNADGAGYYRFTLDEAAYLALLPNYNRLSVPEKKALYDSIFASYKSGEGTLEGLMAVLQLLAGDDAWDVANKPIRAFAYLADHLAPEEVMETYLAAARAAYTPTLANIGLWPYSAADEADPLATALLRDNIVNFLAIDADHDGVRADLAAMAKGYIGFGGDGQLHPDVINADLVDTALIVGVEENGAEFGEAMLALFNGSRDAVLRDDVLRALRHTDDPALATRLFEMILDPALRDNEASAMFFGLARLPNHRDQAWAWLKENINAFLTRIPTWRRGRAPEVASDWCDVTKIDELKAFFAPIIDGFEGGPRLLAETIEKIELCQALKDQRQLEFLLHFGGTPGNS